jgi:hypothetical protein
MKSSGLFNIVGNGLRRLRRTRPFPADGALPSRFRPLAAAVRQKQKTHLRLNSRWVFFAFFGSANAARNLVPEGGIEPPLCCQNWILNPARLPIPPLRHFSELGRQK